VGRYVARRVLVAVPTLAGLSVLIFVLVSLAPGDPAEELTRKRFGDTEPTAADIARTRAMLGLDEPAVTQYLSWLGNALTGDLGTGFSRGRPVSTEIADAFGVTLVLAAAAVLVVVVVAFPLGVAAAMLHNRWPDHLLRLLTLVGASVPGFFLAYVLIYLFAVELGWLPVAGRGGLDHLVLPALTLAVVPTAIVSRLLRSSLLETFGESYVRAARAKGLAATAVVVRHGLRNATIPVVTYLGTLLAGLLDGVLIVEVIFAWPGLGQLTVQAIGARDYPLIQGIVLFAGALYVGLNLLVDLSYRLLDPRIRLAGTGER